MDETNSESRFTSTSVEVFLRSVTDRRKWQGLTKVKCVIRELQTIRIDDEQPVEESKKRSLTNIYINFQGKLLFKCLPDTRIKIKISILETKRDQKSTLR